jgi:hypothetical protein
VTEGSAETPTAAGRAAMSRKRFGLGFGPAVEAGSLKIAFS